MPLSEPMMVKLVTHICVIRLPWVNHLTGHLAIPYCILLNAGIHWNENVILTKLSSKDQGFLYTCSRKSLTGYTESCQNHNFRFRRRKFRRNNQITTLYIVSVLYIHIRRYSKMLTYAICGPNSHQKVVSFGVRQIWDIYCPQCCGLPREGACEIAIRDVATGFGCTNDTMDL